MNPPSLSLRDVTKNFGQTEIIRGVDLDVVAGERHALIGPNGAGKTTLFNLISGRFPITSGEIRTGTPAPAKTATSASSRSRSAASDAPARVSDPTTRSPRRTRSRLPRSWCARSG